jgi:hypothetical protein
MYLFTYLLFIVFGVDLERKLRLDEVVYEVVGKDMFQNAELTTSVALQALPSKVTKQTK